MDRNAALALGLLGLGAAAFFLSRPRDSDAPTADGGGGGSGGGSGSEFAGLGGPFYAYEAGRAQGVNETADLFSFFRDLFAPGESLGSSPYVAPADQPGTRDPEPTYYDNWPYPVGPERPANYDPYGVAPRSPVDEFVAGATDPYNLGMTAALVGTIGAAGAVTAGARYTFSRGRGPSVPASTGTASPGDRFFDKFLKRGATRGSAQASAIFAEQRALAIAAGRGELAAMDLATIGGRAGKAVRTVGRAAPYAAAAIEGSLAGYDVAQRHMAMGQRGPSLAGLAEATSRGVVQTFTLGLGDQLVINPLRTLYENVGLIPKPASSPAPTSSSPAPPPASSAPVSLPPSVNQNLQDLRNRGIPAPSPQPSSPAPPPTWFPGPFKPPTIVNTPAPSTGRSGGVGGGPTMPGRFEGNWMFQAGQPNPPPPRPAEKYRGTGGR